MKITALALASAILLSVFAPVSALAAQTDTAENTEYILPVFETADLHGYLVDTGFEDTADYQYRFARIADAAADRRGGNDAKAILLDGGDIYSGHVIESQQEGNPVSAAYAQAHYDAVALGGHEFDVGLENAVDADGTMPDYAMNGFSGENLTPVLCSNLYNKNGTKIERTKDYVILEKTAVAADGAQMPVKIAVIGYLHNMSGSILPELIADYTVNDSLAPIDALARTLKEEQGADAVILLAHRDAKKTAAALPVGTAVDLVCGADSHYPQTGSERTAYMQPSAKARGFASAELRFTADGAVRVTSMRTVSVTMYENMVHDTPGNSYNLHTSVMTVCRLAVEGIRPLLEAKLGTISAAITSNAVAGSSMASTGGNWMTDMANRACGTQVSFTNSGGIATELLLTNGSRTVTKADIYNLAPYSNRLYVYTLRYSDLLGILNWAVSHTSLNLRMTGIDCYYSDAGVTALVENGVCIYKDGAWAKGYEERDVKISCNAFVATFRGGPFAGFPVTDQSRIDNESFISVLEAEGRENGGQLAVDKTPHILKAAYPGPLANFACVHAHAVPEQKEATCTESGYEKMICDDCGETLSETVVPALGHALTGVAAKPAACTEAGWNAYQVCSRCGFSTQATIPALGHDLDVCAARPASCTEAGWDAYHFCNRCGYSTYTEIAALGHAYQNGVCTRCGERDPDVKEDPKPVRFHDVSKSAWYYDAVQYAVSNGLMNGVGSGRFDPDGSMTRAMLVTVLWRYEGSPDEGKNIFTDVSGGQWYTGSVAWAAASGIVGGVGSGRFDPDGSITREQLAAILCRYAKEKGFDTSEGGSLSAFPDASEVSGYAIDAIAWAVGKGIIGGSDGKLLPQGNATRAQVSTILMRFLGKLTKQ